MRLLVEAKLPEERINAEKLLDLNAQYIRESDTGYLTRTVIPFLEKRGLKHLDETKVARAVETLKIRSKTLDEMADGSLFYFQDEISYEEKADRKFLKPNILGLMEEILERLEKTEVFSQKSLEKVFLDFIEEKQIKLGKIAQPLRVALTGKSASPGLFEVMEILGKEKVLERIRKALTHIARKT